VQPFSFPPVKKKYFHRFCRIAATAAHFPPTIVSNQQIIDQGGLSVTDSAMRKGLGVERRRIAEKGIADSDLLAEAARKCLDRAGLLPENLSKLLVTKFIGDRILPMTAALVQRKLKSPLAFHALDIDGGITAFLNALDYAVRCFSSTASSDQHILIVSGGTHTAAISKTDPRLAFLFGDGAAALLLSSSADQHFLASYFYTNYHYYQSAGSRQLKMDKWLSDDIYEKGNYALLYDFYRMDNWKETIDFTLEAARVTRDNLLLESGLSMKDIDWVLVTENNKKIHELTCETLSVPPEKTITVLNEYGNTMSAMLPILLDKLYTEERLQSGMTVMLISHGEGASGGGMIYRV